MIARPRPQQYELTDPDVRLMLRVRQGDRQAFETLVGRYYERVQGVIEHLLGSRRQVEDLAQEVFLRVYRARKTYSPTSKFSTWLFVIVNNVVRNARRSLARRRELTLPNNPLSQATLDTPARTSEEPGAMAIRDEARQHVRRAIDTLNSRQQKALLLYHYEGMSYAEIADSMETSVLATKALLHRARASLRERLEPYVNA